MLYSAALPYPGDAADYFMAIADLPWAIWLDSAERGRYDILCAQPVATLVTRGTGTVIADNTGEQRSADDPFALLRRQLGETSARLPDDLPFAGGAAGYWGYDLARRLTMLPQSAHDAEQLPEMAVGIYDWAVVIDHQQRTAQLVSQQRSQETAQALPHILARLQHGAHPAHNALAVHGDIRSNLSRDAYQEAFAAVQRYLHEGDCYQVNLAQRYAAEADGDALTAYLALRRLSPAPYSAFLNLPQAQILCASPERFLQVRAGMVETRPIKGTRPRLADPLADARLAEDLRSHPKDRAENLMIVDLLRNDLGRSCVPGSVHVPELFAVESYANVHHLVSTVRGQLAPQQDALALLRNCFPGGSVTGAPKQRAMEIIEQLEPNRRGVYCGSIGYLGFDGSMDTNIAIRTVVYAGNEIRFWAGGGIVADSVMAEEYQETLDKAAAMLRLLQQFGGQYRQ
ncbi:MAG: aminodeoxychorismate synthase component I [Sideroxydans sp.]|nr:aminodeoxychorismate synthase component I [Sideroxydans sp.]